MDSNNKIAVVDFDDLCNMWDCYDHIMKLKDRDENFKCTLFTIPRLSSDALITKYKSLDFVELAMHGWHHTFCEVWGWSDDEAKDKMSLAEKMGIDAKGFKSPKWIPHENIYKACKDMGWWIADHKRNSIEYENYPDLQVYVYNYKKRGEKLIKRHGHTHNVSGNGIEEKFEDFCLPKGTKYKFISELFKNGA